MLRVVHTVYTVYDVYSLYDVYNVSSIYSVSSVYSVYIVYSVYNVYVLQMCSYLGPQGVPRHDSECIPREPSRLTKVGYLPRPLDPQNKYPNIQNEINKCTRTWDPRPPARPPERGGPGGSAPREISSFLSIGL